MINQPQITPYKYPQDLIQLHDWFYNTLHKDNRKRAISKILAYQSRGPIPHSIESTSLLISSILFDEDNNENNILSVRLSYTMTIIKFVNGLLDPYQKSNFAISLHRLAEILKLPSYFVELRHIGTHENLPSIEMLRYCSLKALEWLKINYWDLIIDEYKNLNFKKLIEKNDNNKLKDFKKFLKIIKKIRKENLFINPKEDNKDNEEDKKYWYHINKVKNLSLISTRNLEFIVKILIWKNFLIINDKDLNEKQINGIRLLYEKIINDLGIGISIKIFEKLIELSNSKFLIEISNEKIDEAITNDKFLGPRNQLEIDQSNKWLEWFIIRKRLINSNNIELIITLLKNHSEINIKLLELLINNHNDLLKKANQLDKVIKIFNTMKKFYIPDSSPLFKRKLDDNSNLEHSLSIKRQKCETFLFEPYNDWEPIYFGSCKN